MLAQQVDRPGVESRPESDRLVPRLDPERRARPAVPDGSSAGHWFRLIRVCGLGFGLAILACFAPIGPGEPEPARAGGPALTYKIRPGDTVYGIARVYGVSPQAIVDANGLTNPDRIRAGERLMIPAPEIADATQPAEVHLAALQPAASKPAAAPPPVASPAAQIHRVQPGETLTALAARYGVALDEIVAANELANPNLIRVDQALVIPQPAVHELPATGPPAVTPANIAIPVTGLAPPPGTVPTIAVAPPAGAAPAIVAVPVSPGRTHVVALGETLSGIAEQYQVSSDAIAEANGIVDPHRIQAGLELIVPEPDPERVRPSSRGGLRSTPALTQPGPTSRLLITYYCLPGSMSNGRNVHPGAAASDRSIIPLGSVVEVDGLGVFTIEDQFATDLGLARLDIWVASCQEAIERGVEYRQGRVVGRP